MSKVNNTQKLNSGVDMIAAFRDKVPEQYQAQTSPYINGLLKGLADKKTAAGLTEQRIILMGR